MDVQAGTGCQLTGVVVLHREGRIPAGEIEVGGGNRGAVGEFELCGQLLACRFGLSPSPSGGAAGEGDRSRSMDVSPAGRHRLVGAARTQGEGGYGEQGSDCDDLCAREEQEAMRTREQRKGMRTRGAEEGCAREEQRKSSMR